MKRISFPLLASTFLLAYASVANAQDYQKLAKSPAWKFSQEQTNIIDSLLRFSKDDLTDEQIFMRAVEVIAKEDATAKVTPVQSKSLHLGAWAMKNPLPEYRFFCARL